VIHGIDLKAVTSANLPSCHSGGMYASHAKRSSSKGYVGLP